MDENETIENITNNISDDIDIEEEEIKPIPEILDDDELLIEDDNNKQNENNYKNDDNITYKENSTDYNKTDYFPINFIISNEEIDNININIDKSFKINNNSNNYKGKSINTFSFLTNIAKKIKDKISKNKYITNITDNDKSKDLIFGDNNNDDNIHISEGNKSLGEEEDDDELYEEMDEHFSYFENKHKNKNKDNNNISRISVIKKILTIKSL
jgi:hypothetical protein